MTDPANWSPSERAMAGCEDDRTRCEGCAELIDLFDGSVALLRDAGMIWHLACAAESMEERGEP